MRYSYDYKRKAVELYRLGMWPETPEGINDTMWVNLRSVVLIPHNGI